MEAKIVLAVLIVFVITLSLFLTYIFSKPKIDITAEIAKLNPDSTTIRVLNQADCKSLEKYDGYWVVKDCKGDYYFKFFLHENGYVLGYCTSWSTPREGVLKLREFFGDCLDLNANDEEKMRIGDEIWYSICGRGFVFREECIVGVGA